MPVPGWRRTLSAKQKMMYCYRMATDDDLFWRYAFNFYSRYDPEFECEGACKTTKLCSNQFYSYDETFYCYGDEDIEDDVTLTRDAP